jgi:heme/copper-type cytochrome/quinol oxidase subunit 2
MEEFMRVSEKKVDLILLMLLLVIVVGLPFGILAYDRYFWPKNISPEAKVFTLTGHAQRGWILGDVQARDVVSLWQKNGQPLEKPVIKVSKGQLVVFKLRSSDVTHGFSLKDFEVFLTEGIEPGKTVLVSFRADKHGTFTFSCNAICGENHQIMQGTLIVKA